MTGRDSIFMLVRESNVTLVREALAHDPSVATQRDASGLSPLMHACYRGNPEILNAILAAEPPLDVFDAAAVGRAERLREILRIDAGATSAWSGDGFSPLHLASYFGHAEAVDVLLAHGADARAVARNPTALTALHSAVAGRHHAIAARLLDHGADPDALQSGGWTALHAAARLGDSETVDLLLSRGADATLESDDGRDAAAMAAERGHAALAARLQR
jgi:ankyrin repeat protein